MKSLFFCFVLLCWIVPTRAQTNELWYKNWSSPFLVLFEKDTFDVAESRLFLPYRIFESSKRKTELIYKYTNYKEQGYYRCTYEKGKLKSRVLYLDNYTHIFPWPVFLNNGKASAKREKLRTPLKQASYFTHFTNGRVEEKAFQADTFLQMVNYFMANGRIDSVKISREAYSLNYGVTYDSLGRLTMVQAVENGDSYVAQRRNYRMSGDAYSSGSYFTVEDSLMGYSRLKPREKETFKSNVARDIAHDEIEDTNYFFKTTHILSPGGEHEIYYKAYEIARGSFNGERHYARWGQTKSAGSSYLATQKTRYESAEFKKEVHGRVTEEAFCPNGYEELVGDMIFVDPRWGYSLSRSRKHPRHFSVYAKPPNSIQKCDYPKGVDSMKLMEVLVK